MGFLREGNKARFVIAGEKCSGEREQKVEKRSGSSGFLPLFPLLDFLCSFLLPTLLILTYSLSQLSCHPRWPHLSSAHHLMLPSHSHELPLFTHFLSHLILSGLSLCLYPPLFIHRLSSHPFLSVLSYVKSPFLSMFISVSLHLFSASSLYLPSSDSPCPPLYFSAHQSDVPIVPFILLSCI